MIGVDSFGSVYKKYFETGEYDKNEIKPYMTEGIGEDIIPGTIDFSYVDEVIQVGIKKLHLEQGSLRLKKAYSLDGRAEQQWKGPKYVKQIHYQLTIPW